jgi:hypothetical protein
MAVASDTTVSGFACRRSEVYVSPGGFSGIIVSTLIRLMKLGWFGSWPRMLPASTPLRSKCSTKDRLFQQPASK